MIFECIKRIFGRKDHTCLSSENKPKVVEVILKFAKLYDGVDLSKDDILRSHFDDFEDIYQGFSFNVQETIINYPLTYADIVSRKTKGEAHMNGSIDNAKPTPRGPTKRYF